MADERETAAVNAAAQSTQQVNAGGSQGKHPRGYVVHVYDECWAPIEEPPSGPAADRSVSARLDAIEQQLQRVLALLEKSGS